MWRRYKPFLQTNDFIKEIITITVVTIVTPYITITERDYIALYVIGKDITHRNILSVTRHPRDTLYMPTCFHHNICNT